MIDALQDFTSSFPALLQWVGVMLVAAIPFVDSYFGSVIGVLAGLNPVVAIAAAIVGNVLAMLIFVFAAHRVRTGVVNSKAPRQDSARSRKVRAWFDKYGVAGVSLVGPVVLPSQFTSAAMVSFGASKNSVILWQIIAITIWGVVFGTLATVGITLSR
ncbi:small multi-drug export protein [Microterricola viridarii]|uniref:Small multi-drug export protein n=1 Tax=Microterricola viridarii TaxID=412690 RepID=A0A1H1NCH0_9MICO|nr:small multi-drug export protein [Microterricola viridarii]SDR96435.1 hypothetical protein SAMN04489834_0605 [Microterricola viridarii]